MSKQSVPISILAHNSDLDDLAQSVPTGVRPQINVKQSKVSLLAHTTVTAVALISDFASWSAATTTKLQVQQKKAPEKKQAASRHATPSHLLPRSQAKMSVDGSRQGTP